MNFQEQIEYIFGDVTDTLTIYDNHEKDSEDLSVGSIDAVCAAAESITDPYIATIMGGKVYAFSSELLPADSATLRYTSVDGDIVNVFVLVDPVNISSLADGDLTEIPMAGPWWSVSSVTDKMYTTNDLEELAEEYIDEHPDVDIPESVEDAELVEEGKNSAGPSANGAVGAASRDTGANGETQSINDSGGTEKDDRSHGNGNGDIAPRNEPKGSVGEPIEKGVLNDAVILGETNPDLDKLYEQNFTFMTGDLYGQRDRRNTQEGQWQAQECTLMEWLYGAEKSANGPVWGLTRHPEGAVKEGASLVLASAIDGARTDSAIETIYAIVLDIDGGASLKKTVAKLVEKDIFATVYTTFSHNSKTVTLKHDDIVKKLKLEGSPNLAQIKTYMAAHQADKYTDEFIEKVTIKELSKQTATGIKVILDTPAVDKFRVILPLWEPIKLSTLGPTVSAWKEAWEDAVCGVAINMLNVNFDTASCDVNRLFYTPRHPKGRDDWKSYLIQGQPLRFEDIEPYPKSDFVRDRKSGNNPFAVAGGGDTKNKPAFAPSGASLNTWHTDIGKERFMIADVLETFCEDRLRVSGNEKEGSVHTVCPFEHGHSDEGGTACMAVNAVDSESGYWTWFCRHDSCSGRHKLEFLEEALKESWFEESILKDDEFLMPAEDGEEDTVFEGTSNRTPLERCADFDSNSSEKDIKNFLTELGKENVDQVIQNSVTETLAKTTMLGKRNLTTIWRDITREKVKRDREISRQDATQFSGTIAVNTADIQDQYAYALNRIEKCNDKHPTLFHYMGAMGRVREDERGMPRIDVLTEDQFAYELNTISTFAKVTMIDGGESSRNVAAPRDVVNHLYHADLSTYPRLRGITTSPTFAADGSMIVKPGFHSPSGIMYMPDHNTSIPAVSTVPTEDELEDAKHILIDDAFADFPIGGYIDYRELISDSVGIDGVPAMTTLIGMLLLFFCRDMIDGPTPGHLFTKPAPGTGASLLAELCAIIGVGAPVGATALPKTDEEMRKTLLTKMLTGVPMIYFDNIDSNVNSSELASALTSDSLSGRILGGMKDANVEIRSIFAFTGNNVQISPELLRRLVLVDLDAHTDAPGDRKGFRNEDIKGWAKKNRGELVWACLTLIQNYVAKGQIPYRDRTLNSFENWSKVIGGIMRDAGIGGFLGNIDRLKDIAEDESDVEINNLVEVWWAFHQNKHVHIKSDEDPQALAALAIAQGIELPVKKVRDENGGAEYNSKSFGSMLRRYRGRVYALADGTKVTMKRDDERSSIGFAWYLEATEVVLKQSDDSDG